jgi:hypothetical protein
MPGMIGFLLLMLCFVPDEEIGVVGRVGLFFLGVGLIAAALYVAFGSAKVLKNWDHKIALEEQRREARRAQGLKGLLFGYAGISRRGAGAASVSAAQIRAVSNPETARSLQELQKLLYTQAISDHEFQAAKDKLLRSEEARAQDDALAQLQKLIELREAGVLNDVEFAAAKFKVLGL